MGSRKNSQQVAELLRQNPPVVDDLRQARLERGVLEVLHEDRTPAKGVSRRGSWVAGGVLVAAAAAAVLVFAAMPTPDAGGMTAAHPSASFRTFSGGALVHRGAIAEGDRVDTESGQRVEVVFGGEGASSTRIDVGPESSARFAEIRDGSYLIRLERGSVDVAFHPEERGREGLVVETGSARVEVVGTEFSVEVESGGATRVRVREGLVRVVPRGAGTVRMVGAGEETLVDPQVAATGVGRSADQAGGIDETDETEDTVEADETVEAAPTPAPSDPSEAPVPPASPSRRHGGPRLPTGTASSASPTEQQEGTAAEAAVAHSILEGEAIDEEAIAQLPSDIRFTLAERLLADGQYDRGRHILHSIARDPQTLSDRVRAWTLNAESYARQGRYDDATEAYRRAADGALDSAEGLAALYSLARLKDRLADWAGAEAAYRRYLAHAPNGAHAGAARDALCRVAPGRCGR